MAISTAPVPTYDVVVVGAGPSGLMLSTCLARWGYRIKHVDNRTEPTQTGRADAIQPRTLHFLRNMGLKRGVMAQGPAKFYETAFWGPNGSGSIGRTGTWPSCPDSINAAYGFTTMLHQGGIENVFIDDLQKNGVEIQRPWTIAGFEETPAESPEYPIQVSLKHVNGHKSEVVRTKYLFSGEGAKSSVRDMLGIKVQYLDDVTHYWGVLDGRVRTDYPDIKMMSTIHSRHGSILIVPRERGLARFYIQMTAMAKEGRESLKTVTVDKMQALARKIMSPYRVDWLEVEWYSMYPIRQGIAERYTLDERVFLGGDACHTHSPKAGQGMNAAFMDAANLAWKIHHVESGFADRSVLKSYEVERRKFAQGLLDFDNAYVKLMSQDTNGKKANALELINAVINGHSNDSEFLRMFKASRELVSGYGVFYGPGTYNWSADHPARSPGFMQPGKGPRIGRIMPHANVRRVTDANKVPLDLVIPFNGSFRIYIFAGDYLKTRQAIQVLGKRLERRNSFFQTHLRKDIDDLSETEQANPHSHLFSICTIFSAQRVEIDIVTWLPAMLARYRDHVYADDLRDVKLPGVQSPAHVKMGLDEENGGIVVVRPDGYVGCSIQLEDGDESADALEGYFNSFNAKPLKRSGFLAQTHVRVDGI